MKLAFSSNAYKTVSLEAAIESIASLGYSGVELMADVPHAYPRDMGAARVAGIRGQLSRLGVAISNVNAFTLFAQGDTYHPTWIEEDAGLRAARVRHTLDVIRMLAALREGRAGDAATISLQPGGPLGSVPREVVLARFEEGLRECLPLAKSLGITLMVEPEPGLLIQHSAECMAFLERVNDPHLKMNCDLGHFFCVGEDPAEVLRACAECIGHVHVEDIPESRVHQHLIPGRGGMEWGGIFAALREIGYEGWLTVELYPYETTAEEAGREAMGFLRGFVGA